jgi:two-component system KDP operon response regulator KdpE
LKERVRILVVDDDLLALRYVRDALSKAGYTPIVTGDPQEALALMYEMKPQLALLDLMLPGTDGIELMKEILEIGAVPVIFLSAYGQDHFIARAIDMGAADYVVKPFSPTELTARIRGALRKWAGPDPLEPFVLGELVIDYVTRQVTLAGEPVRLTAIEYRTLVELSLNAGQVLTYEYLLRKIWDVGSHGDLRPMRTVMSTLRRRLGDDADSPSYIFTEPRVGYRMAIADSREANPPVSL